ncbi:MULTISPECIES: hypothetical protein [Elizabethkingia]|uniref:Uncharacterized protein n=1 Tax=Elizabethkingia anophelis TaxID=1117645 RepID=A0AAE4NY80_9FLAO|nr:MULTISPECIES: hypothetical protein [Elizabethkingia]MBG0514571.1 hypothetical protein [Elizabethkingia meningoseptica]MDV3662447.1 hypothetical protein [Elizabethkingia anophelis]CDN79510.1 hypothetical protein E27107_60084 [Elizabethkingia anophelis]
MNSRTKESKRLLESFKKALQNGTITREEYDAAILLLIDKMSFIEHNPEQINYLLNKLSEKIKSDISLIETINLSFCMN